jgi:hypothetical protein
VASRSPSPYMQSPLGDRPDGRHRGVWNGQDGHQCQSPTHQNAPNIIQIVAEGDGAPEAIGNCDSGVCGFKLFGGHDRAESGHGIRVNFDRESHPLQTRLARF